MGKRYTVCVDFDGVLHLYRTPWQAAHVIPDPPTPGAVEWLHRTLQKFDVAILSTRTKTWRGRRAIRAWLREHWGNLYYGSPGCRGVEDVTLTATKPPALIYLDDRAYRFEGDNWPTPNDVHQSVPWMKDRPRSGQEVLGGVEGEEDTCIGYYGDKPAPGGDGGTG